VLLMSLSFAEAPAHFKFSPVSFNYNLVNSRASAFMGASFNLLSNLTSTGENAERHAAAAAA